MENHREVTELTQQILESSQIPAYKIPYPITHFPTVDLGLRKEIFHYENIMDSATPFFYSFEPTKLYFYSDIFQCNYAALLLPDQKFLFWCGPVIYGKMQGERFEQLFASLQLPGRYREPLLRYYHQIRFLPVSSLFKNILQEYGKMLYGEHLEIIYRDLTVFERYDTAYNNIFRIPDKPFANIHVVEKHYEMENTIMYAINSGNESLALETLSKLQKRTNISSDNPSEELRYYKNYLISFNALARKAAEAGGVHPVYFDDISHSLLQEIEDCTSVEQCQMTEMKIAQTYCYMTRHNIQQSHSPLIKKMLTYIDTDLRVDLTLKTFAEYLNVNASYLSTLFSKEMGMSLTEYVTSCRIQHAQKLLLGTTLPIKTIAEQCGYLDIHYFSRLFKKFTQTTPKEYRNSYHYVDKRELHRLQTKP